MSGNRSTQSLFQALQGFFKLDSIFNFHFFHKTFDTTSFSLLQVNQFLNGFRFPVYLQAAQVRAG